jgi:L-ribulose-5-phosphate 3-epimerase
LVCPSDDFDNVEYLEKMLPWAVGMSCRNQPTEELTVKMIKLSKDAGHKGWYGIESSGREAILQGKQLLKKYWKSKKGIYLPPSASPLYPVQL